MGEWLTYPSVTDNEHQNISHAPLDHSLSFKTAAGNWQQGALTMVRDISSMCLKLLQFNIFAVGQMINGKLGLKGQNMTVLFWVMVDGKLQLMMYNTE